MRSAEVSAERTICNNMKNKVDNLVTALNPFIQNFVNCSSYFKEGGMLVDGTPVDVYAFGGFEKYANENIKPMVDQLVAVSSTLAEAIKQLDIEIQRLEAEERAAEAKKSKPSPLKGKTTTSDKATTKNAMSDDRRFFA